MRSNININIIKHYNNNKTFQIKQIYFKNIFHYNNNININIKTL